MSETEPTTTEPADIEITEDTHTPEAEETRREEAFQSEQEWNGKPLHPYSIGRESLFYELRQAMGAPDLTEALYDGSAFLSDALRLLWLCSHEPQDWRFLRKNKPLMQETIEAWAEQNVTPDQTVQAIRLGSRIVTQNYENRHKVAPSQSQSAENPMGK